MSKKVLLKEEVGYEPQNLKKKETKKDNKKEENK